MATKPEFAEFVLILVTKDEMFVSLANVSVAILSPGMAFKILCQYLKACSLVKGKGQIGPLFVFLCGQSLIPTRDSRNGALWHKQCLI